MYYGVDRSTTAILQLLIDAGGNPDRDGRARLLTYVAVDAFRRDSLQVLLAQPCLDCTVAHKGITAEYYARRNRRSALADMVASEVRNWYLGDFALFDVGLNR